MTAKELRPIPAAAPSTEAALRFLLDGDVAIRWQARRDLLDAPPGVVERERGRVAREGWGARLLARQDPAGTWAGGQSSDGGLYSPKWISTTYTMLLLRDLGLPAGNRQAKRACALLLDEGLRKDGGINYGPWGNRGETCITGMVLSILAHFRFDDDRLHVLAGHLLEQQMADGGWNCQRPYGATHSSVHTTISALEGLREYELARDGSRKGPALRAVRDAQLQGREFLLEHRLFRSHRTGEIIKRDFLRFVFPPRWHYDVLRALDYFQAVGAELDPRLEEAIALLHAKRGADGRWKVERGWRGKTWFELEAVGKASRWNTLRALRVVRWWEGRSAGAAGTPPRSRPQARAPRSPSAGQPVAAEPARAQARSSARRVSTATR
jgi:hypothetical protein